MSACLFVCLFVSLFARISHKNACPNLTKFSVHVSSGRSSVVFWRQRDILCTSGFMDDVVFTLTPVWVRSTLISFSSPKSKPTRAFRPVRQVAAPVGRQTLTLFYRHHHVAAPGRSLTSLTASCSKCISKSDNLGLTEHGKRVHGSKKLWTTVTAIYADG